uniref:C2H2-type domain-containing protein n=1 Tax=Angiostrongylus cantonensis TaxID=6313 RepID=A0A0K0DD62_ANGCA
MLSPTQPVRTATKVSKHLRQEVHFYNFTICWLMDHYRTRHARAANPFHCVIEGCQMRFSTTRRLEEHVRLEHINPPKPSMFFSPRPTIYCPYFDEQLLKCVRFMNKHNFNVAFKPVNVHIDLKGAKRRKQKHRYVYRIVSSGPTSPVVREPKIVSYLDKAFFSNIYNPTSHILVRESLQICIRGFRFSVKPLSSS